MESGEITLAGDAPHCCTIRRCAQRISAKRPESPGIPFQERSHSRQRKSSARTGYRSLAPTRAGDTPRRRRARCRLVFRRDAAVEARPRRLPRAGARHARVQPRAQPRADRGHRARQLLLPLLECGLLYASLAADRGEPPRLRHIIGAAAAPPRALAAVVAASLVIFAVESIVAQAVGGINMLSPADDAEAMSGRCARRHLRRRDRSRRCRSCSCRSSRCSTARASRTAFAQSIAAFNRNPGALLLFGALSFALLMLGLATSGIGLLLALPWSAAASYAAWKEIFSVA